MSAVKGTESPSTNHVDSIASAAPLTELVRHARQIRATARQGQGSCNEVDRQQNAIRKGIQLCIDKCIIILVETGFTRAQDCLTSGLWNRMRVRDVIQEMQTNEIHLTLAVDHIQVTVQLVPANKR